MKTYTLAALIAGLSTAQQLRPGTELAVGECRFDDDHLIVLYQLEKTKNDGSTKMSGVRSKYAGNFLDADTEYQFQVRDYSPDGGCGSGNVIERVADFYPDWDGSIIGGNFAKYFGLFSSYDYYFGSDFGRDITLEDDWGVSYCCTIEGGMQDDKAYLRELNREFRGMYNDIMRDSGRNLKASAEGRSLSGHGYFDGESGEDLSWLVEDDLEADLDMLDGDF